MLEKSASVRITKTAYPPPTTFNQFAENLQKQLKNSFLSSGDYIVQPSVKWSELAPK